MLYVAALFVTTYVPTSAGPRCTSHLQSTRLASALSRSPLLIAQEGDSPLDALAAQKTQAEAVSSELAEAAEEVAQMEAATAEELGLTADELETFMDGEDDTAEAPAGSSSPVEAMADLMTVQEDASAALKEGFQEFEEIEKEIAGELGVTVEELEVAEDYNLESPPPEGFEWGVTY